MKTVNKNLLKKVVASSAALALPLALIVKEGHSLPTESSDTAKAKIKVLRALKITKTQDLNFPDIYTTDTGVVSVDKVTDTSRRAEFEITGRAGQAINVTFDTVLVNMDSKDPTHSPSTDPNARITADLKPSITLTGLSGSMTLSGTAGSNAQGTGSLQVGGDTENLDGNQLAADYEGSFTVTVVYN